MRTAEIVHLDTSPGVLYGLEAILGLGAGSYTQAAYAVIQAVLPRSEAANGLSLMLLGMSKCEFHLSTFTEHQNLILLAQLGGLTLGLSIGGAVFINVSSGGLYNLLPDVPHEQVQQMVSGTSGTLLSSLSREMHDRVLEVIVQAWNDVYVIPCFPEKST